MVENTAFKLFEDWWDEKKTETNEKSQSTFEENVTNNVVKDENNKQEGLSSLIEQATPLGFNYDGFGLGIRASMPKMPSFRVSVTFIMKTKKGIEVCNFYLVIFQRKIKPPSPMPQDEDSRLSDRLGTELIESDSDLDLPAVSKTKRPLASLPSASTSSSSSAASSSDDTSSSESSSESSDDEEFAYDPRPLASASENTDIIMELAIQRSLHCQTPPGRETPLPDLIIHANDNELPEICNDASPISSPVYPHETKEENETKIVNDIEMKLIDRPKTPETKFMSEVKKTENLWNQEPRDIERMESSAAEALMTLAGQDNIIRHKSPGPIQPNIIRSLETLSSKYINDTPILKESEKIEISFSEIPTTDSEEESLEIRRLRFQAEANLRLNGDNYPEGNRPLVFAEHSYSLLPAKPAVTTDDKATVESEPIAIPAPLPIPPKAKPAKLDKRKEKAEKRKNNKISKLHIQNYEREKENIEIENRKNIYEIPKMAQPEITYKERDLMSEMSIFYQFLTRGIDAEDVEYLRRSYEALLADDAQGYWLNDTHWVDHPPTDVPSPAKRRKRDDLRLHATGCARTEGYYKVDIREKAKHKVSTSYILIFILCFYLILFQLLYFYTFIYRNI